MPSSRQIIRDHHKDLKRDLDAESEKEPPSRLDELPDEVLLVMLNQAANGEYDEACDSVTKWCSMDKRRNDLCRTAGERQWGEMTTRIFGANTPTLVAGDPMNNFFALCKREQRERALKHAKEFDHERYERYEDEKQEEFLNAMTDIMLLKARGGKETAEGRVLLATMVVNVIEEFYLDFGEGHDIYQFEYEVIGENMAYAMLEGTDAEVDAGLALLTSYARGHDDNAGDYRSGYGYGGYGVTHNVRLLKQLIKAGDPARKEQIVDLWAALIEEIDDADRHEGVRDYVYVLMDEKVDELIVNHLATRPTYAQKCGELLASMAKAIRNVADQK